MFMAHSFGLHPVITILTPEVFPTATRFNISKIISILFCKEWLANEELKIFYAAIFLGFDFYIQYKVKTVTAV